MNASQRPLPEQHEGFQTIFAAELARIREWRINRGVADAAAPTPAPPTADSMRLIGLAFSGGGIRSATFNLGVLQALAQLKILRHIDYLSTVSGGGYIGGWLNAMIYRAANGIDDVESGLDPDQATADSLPQKAIARLRAFSNYLTPKVSLLSADTWSLWTIWSRNTLLNLVVLVTGIAALILLGRLFGMTGLTGITGAGLTWVTWLRAGSSTSNRQLPAMSPPTSWGTISGCRSSRTNPRLTSGSTNRNSKATGGSGCI